jgi:hypothetical protein
MVHSLQRVQHFLELDGQMISVVRPGSASDSPSSHCAVRRLDRGSVLFELVEDLVENRGANGCAARTGSGTRSGSAAT